MRSHSSGYKFASACRRQQAGFWREIRRAGNWHKIEKITKVKAHAKEESAGGHDECVDIMGNNLADRYAKQGAELHRESWGAGSVAWQLKSDADNVAAMLAIGRMLALWPPARQLWKDEALDVTTYGEDGFVAEDRHPENLNVDKWAEEEEAASHLFGDDVEL